MRSENLTVQRFNSIPGIGAKVINVTESVQQAETPEDILSLFLGTQDELSAFVAEQKANGVNVTAEESSEKYSWSCVYDAINRAKRAEVRSAIIAREGGSDMKSAVATAKAAINVMLNVYPGKSKAEVAQIVVTEELRVLLAKEGVEFGDPKALKAKYASEADSPADDSEDEE